MPTRSDIFINKGLYHIFNKTIDKKLIFSKPQVSLRFLNLLPYYRSSKADIRYSKFMTLLGDQRFQKEIQIYLPKYYKVEILSYCLMPNHFHFQLKQRMDKGIVMFMAEILNSITRYFNVLYDRKGPIFLPQFRSRRITSHEQLIHISRYIHLNPYSGGYIKNIKDLVNYEHSSFNEYVTNNRGLCNLEPVLSGFTNKEKYKEFVFKNAEYQKTLEYAKYTERWR